MIYPPLTRFEFVDDGWYNNQWNIYEADGRIFAQAFSQQAAEEIFFAVNFMRGRLSAEHDAQVREYGEYVERQKGLNETRED